MDITKPFFSIGGRSNIHNKESGTLAEGILSVTLTAVIYVDNTLGKQA